MRAICVLLVSAGAQPYCDRSGRSRIRGVIVDPHLHVDDIPALGWKLGADLCIERMDEAGIEVGVIMTIVDAPEVNPDALELIAEACAAHPGRLEAFARLHPWYPEAPDLLERAFALGFK